MGWDDKECNLGRHGASQLNGPNKRSTTPPAESRTAEASERGDLGDGRERRGIKTRDAGFAGSLGVPYSV